MKQTAHEYWEQRFGAPPTRDSELLAVAMMHEYAEAQKPKVKPLEWVDDGAEGFLTHPALKDAFFHVMPEHDGWILYSAWAEHHASGFATVEEAKAAAQADYAEQVAKLYE